MKRYYISKECYYNIYKVKNRIIHAPNKVLKKAQRSFLKNICNYNKRISLKSVAQIHCGQNWILKIDIKDFYNSISAEQIKSVIKTLNELQIYTLNQPSYIYRMCTISHKLPTGAPTSPFFANYIMKEIDWKIINCCGTQVKYSRYMDDMFFSAFSKYQLNYIETEVTKLLHSYGFSINSNKIFYISNNKQQRILGLLVNNKQVCLTKNKKREYRALFYNHLKTFAKHQNTKADKRVAGHLAYIKNVDKKFYTQMSEYVIKLIEKFKIEKTILKKIIVNKKER